MNLFSRKAHRDARRHDRRRAAVSIEGLESRQVMAASIALSAGSLNIKGDATNDQIMVQQIGTQVRAQVYSNGTLVKEATYARSAVQRMTVEAFAGSDVVTNSTNIPATMQGGAGDDTINGGSGDDVYKFGTGHLGIDRITDAGGVDTLDFSTYGRTVVLDLARTDQQDVLPYFPNDDIKPAELSLTLPAAIENVIGSSQKDWIRGNALANSIKGGAGNDILEGRAGDDTLEGGAGNDTYTFVGSAVLGTDSLAGTTGDGVDALDFTEFSAGVTVDLAQTASQVVKAGKLSVRLGHLAAIEKVIGSHFADSIKGNALANWLEGNLGDDRIEGRMGNDTLEGGQGDDTYAFTGSDNLGTDRVIEDDDSHGPNPDMHDRYDFTGFAYSIKLDLSKGGTQVLKAGKLSLNQSKGAIVEHVVGATYQ